MRPVKSRGTGRTALLRLGSIAAATACSLLAWCGTATAAPSNLTFFPAHVPVVFNATGTGGAKTNVTVLVAISELLPANQLSALPLPAPPQGETYFEVKLQPQDPANGGPIVPLAIPKADATLVTSAGTVAAVAFDPGPNSLDANWFFPVPDSITQATLVLASSTVTAYGSDGSQETFAIEAVTIDFATDAPGSVPVPISGGSHATAGPPAVAASNRSAGSGVNVGVVLGGLVLLGVGMAVAVTVGRRRAFYRADREGRVVLVGPPSLSAAAMAARLSGGGAVGTGARDRHGIVVKLLGWLEIEGTAKPVTAGPVLELIVFMALNPGRSFTSVQLRESIWGLSRQPITPGSFRKYMVDLRKAFGPGVVVTDKYRYEMTNAVTSDLDQFRAILEADDVLAGREGALDLVRGPVLNGCFDGTKNGPFRWAIQKANDIEDEVTSVAFELALSCLDLDEPQRAARAVSQGLLCAETNTRLRLLDLRVGAALGGSKEVGRRLQAGQAALVSFPTDVAQLERVAGNLGWSVMQAK